MTDTYEPLHSLFMDDRFLKQPFQQQISTTRELLLRTDQSKHDGIVIAHSYGAYLVLHSLIGEAVFAPKIILVSPILGYGSSNGFMMMAAGRKRLSNAITENNFPMINGVALVGEHDTQTSIETLRILSNATGLRLDIASGQTHQIEPSLIRNLLEREIA